MNETTHSVDNGRLRLKEPSGWFAAGKGFRLALTLLSDGAFQLFAYLCLEANRQTGRIEATHKELATALRKSKRSIGNHIEELQAHQVCNVLSAKNQYARTVFEISDRYWPYHRNTSIEVSADEGGDIAPLLSCRVRRFFEVFARVADRISLDGLRFRRLESQAKNKEPPKGGTPSKAASFSYCSKCPWRTSCPAFSAGHPGLYLRRSKT